MIAMFKNKILPLLISFLAIFSFICFLYHNNQFVTYKYSMPTDAYSYNLEDIKEFYGIEKNGNFFTVNEEDAYFVFETDKDVRALSLDLLSSQENMIKLYYSSNDSFSEIETISKQWENEDTLIFNIHDNNVHRFMVKIKNDFSVNSIKMSNEEVVKTENGTIKRNDLKFFVLNFIISVVMSYIMIKFVIKVIKKIKEIDKKKILTLGIRCGMYFLTLLLLIILQKKFTKGLILYNGNRYVINYFRVIFTLGFNTLIWGIVWLRDCFKNNKLEKIFLLVSLSIGIPFAISLPMLQETTWDAGIHYGNTIEIVYFNSDQLPEIDKTVGWLQYSYNFDEFERITDKYDEMYKSSTLIETKDMSIINYYNKIGYIPLATGIFVARGLNFSFTQSIVVGKIFNIIFYSIIIYFAIKRISKGKILIFILSLFPTVIMLASTYSYDGWVFGWMILGLSYLFANYQEKEKQLSVKEGIIIGGSLFLSLGPKAIYFPIMLLCLFLPKEKFASKRNRYIFNAYIVILMCVSLSTFIIPFIFGVSSGTAGGDLRGGSDVNSTLQIKYIFDNPAAYTKTLLTFLKDYWGLSNIQYYTTYFAYIPSVGRFTSILVIEIIAALIIGEEINYTKKGIFLKIACLIVIFGISCLVATALYVSFTPVGLDGIAGCQPRYLLPLLFPVLYSLYNVYKPIHLNRTVFNWIVCSLSIAILVYNVLFQVVLQYWVS